ncbi:MAG: FtsX-like permease family protein [Candidatus Limnocylindrales bacterium]
MRRLSSLAWRSLWGRPLRSLLTAAGIALGVAVLFAALVTNASIDAAADRTVRAVLGRSDLRVAAFTEAGLTEPTVRAIASTPGVAVAVPELERRTYLQARLGAVPGGLPGPVTVLGIDPNLDGRLHDLPLAKGTGLSGGPEPSAVVSEALARAEHLALGDELTLLGSAAAGPTAYRIVGLVAGDGPLPDAAGRVVVLPLAAAKTLFDLQGVTRVDVGLAPGADPVKVSAALESRITREPYVLSAAADLVASLRASTAGFQATTALLAAVALFVGAFLIFNTLSMTVSERVREVGLLRAAGASRGQVRRLILVQALALGVAGSVVGLLAGLGLATVLAGTVGAFGSIQVEAIVVPPLGVALALGLGLLITLGAALEPAWRVGRVSPVEALRPGSVQTAAGRAHLRWLVLVFAVVAAAGLLLWPSGVAVPGLAAGPDPLGGLLRSLAVYGLLLLAAVVSPFFLGPLGRLVGLPLAVLLRTEERLARSALARDRSRTALTMGSLTVGLAMIVAIGAVAGAARGSATDWLARVIPGDELLTSIRPVAPDEPQLAQLTTVPGVARVSPIATFGVAYQGRRLDGAAVVGADMAEDGRLTFTAGDRATALAALDSGGAAVLPASLADRLSLHLGDRPSFTTGATPTVLRIVGIVDRSIPGASGEAILVGWGDARTAFGVTGARLLAVRYAPGQAASARLRLDALARSLALEPADLDAVGGAVSDALARVLGLFDALAAIAVVIAGLGIVNTLTMSVSERVREIGVLRAIGMTRAQVWRMVVVEAGILGVVGALLGCLVGLTVAALMLRLATIGGDLANLPWPTVGLAFVLGVAVSTLAAAYPARLASGISIVRAVQYE